MNNNEFISELYKEHINLLSVLIKRELYSKQLEDISDCLEDVFLVAIKKIDKLKAHPNKSGWLIIVAKNEIKKRNKLYLSEKKFRYSINDIDTVSNHDFTDKIIEDFLLNNYKESGIFKKFIKTLSPNEREFYNLKYIKKYEISEISKITGKSIKSLYTMNNRVKNKMKNLL